MPRIDEPLEWQLPCTVATIPPAADGAADNMVREWVRHGVQSFGVRVLEKDDAGELVDARRIYVLDDTTINVYGGPGIMARVKLRKVFERQLHATEMERTTLTAVIPPRVTLSFDVDQNILPHPALLEQGESA